MADSADRLEPIMFSLEPFEETAQTRGLQVTGSLSITQTLLSLTYLLAESSPGRLTKVDIPTASGVPSRKDRLWEQTCFEFFLAAGSAHRHSDPYWEFNLSPAGDWNVFALQRYRQGLQEENSIAQLPFTVWSSEQGLHLDISLDIGQICEAATGPLRLGVSMVIVVGGEESFWAIAHPTTQADFHHPDSFVITLNPSQ